MAEHQLPKLNTRVRFPSSAPDLPAKTGGDGAGTAPTPVDEPVNEPTVKSEWDKTGRNEPCPCGSGKKYKLCHGR